MWSTSWPIVEQGIHRIHLKESYPLSFEELYRNAYLICMRKQGRQLYAAVHTVITGHVALKMQQLAASPDATVLADCVRLWGDHLVALGMTQSILMYLDTKYLPTVKLPSIYEVGVRAFREGIMENGGRAIERVVNVVLEMIKAERDGEIVDRLLIKRTTEMLLALCTCSEMES